MSFGRRVPRVEDKKQCVVIELWQFSELFSFDDLIFPPISGIIADISWLL